MALARWCCHVASRRKSCETCAESGRVSRCCCEGFPSGSLEEQVSLSAAEAQQNLEAINGIFEPPPDGEESETKENSQTTNVLVIRFERDGQVVWAAPPTISSWDQPGQLLFVVKLDARLGGNVNKPICSRLLFEAAVMSCCSDNGLAAN